MNEIWTQQQQKTDETVIQSESRTNQSNNFQCGRVACRREVNVSIASHFLTGRWQLSLSQLLLTTFTLKCSFNLLTSRWQFSLYKQHLKHLFTASFLSAFTLLGLPAEIYTQVSCLIKWIVLILCKTKENKNLNFHFDRALSSLLPWRSPRSQLWRSQQSFSPCFTTFK